jgi:uncharacterized protein DUF3784
MSPQILAPVVVLLFAGLPLLVLGYLIRYRKRLGLIAGYDPARVRDPEGLARWFGSWVLALGALSVIFAGLLAAPSSHTGAIVVGYVVVDFACAAVLVLGCRRYTVGK